MTSPSLVAISLHGNTMATLLLLFRCGERKGCGREVSDHRRTEDVRTEDRQRQKPDRQRHREKDVYMAYRFWFARWEGEYQEGSRRDRYCRKADIQQDPRKRGELLLEVDRLEILASDVDLL